MIIGSVLTAALLFYAGRRIGTPSARRISSGKTSPASAAAPTLNPQAQVTDENFHILQGMAYAEAEAAKQSFRRPREKPESGDLAEYIKQLDAERSTSKP